MQGNKDVIPEKKRNTGMNEIIKDSVTDVICLISTLEHLENPNLIEE